MARAQEKRVRDKVSSHERIVKAAARAIRRDGADRISVAALMEQAGLTHGGFYRHFSSREDLIDAATAEALADGGRLTATEGSGLPPDVLRAIVDAYLSPAHRDHPETGCAVGALAADVTRASDTARASYTAQVQQYIDALTSAVSQREPGSPSAREEAILALAAMVGGILIARATTGTGLSDEILQSVHHALLTDTPAQLAESQNEA